MVEATEARPYRTLNPPLGPIDALRRYFGIIPLSGGALGTGFAYWSGFYAGAAKELVTYIPALVAAEDYQVVQDALYAAGQKGLDTATGWAILGGIVGLVVTNKFRDTIASFIKK